MDGKPRPLTCHLQCHHHVEAPFLLIQLPSTGASCTRSFLPCHPRGGLMELVPPGFSLLQTWLCGDHLENDPPMEDLCVPPHPFVTLPGKQVSKLTNLSLSFFLKAKSRCKSGSKLWTSGAAARASRIACLHAWVRVLLTCTLARQWNMAQAVGLRNAPKKET